MDVAGGVVGGGRLSGGWWRWWCDKETARRGVKGMGNVGGAARGLLVSALGGGQR